MNDFEIEYVAAMGVAAPVAVRHADKALLVIDGQIGNIH